MLIWLAKWVDQIDGITVDRPMVAIDAFCLRGLDTHSGRSQRPEDNWRLRPDR